MVGRPSGFVNLAPGQLSFSGILGTHRYSKSKPRAVLEPLRNTKGQNKV
jgi:hypothetical protein